MNTFLTACRNRGTPVAVALLALAAGAHTARADYLVRTYADTAPAYVRSALPETNVSPPLACREPLTVYRPHDDSSAPPDPEIDEAALAAALQALLVCAIPPPTDTIIQTATPPDTPQDTQQPGVPPAPQYILPVYPDGTTDSGGPHAADAPEPATLVTALVGSGLAGIALWHRRGKKKRRRTLAA
jgi:hypothetical protein